MSCTRHVVLKRVLKTVSSECDAYPTVSASMVEGHLVKHHEVLGMYNDDDHGSFTPRGGVKNTYHIQCNVGQSLMSNNIHIISYWFR